MKKAFTLFIVLLFGISNVHSQDSLKKNETLNCAHFFDYPIKEIKATVSF